MTAEEWRDTQETERRGAASTADLIIELKGEADGVARLATTVATRGSPAGRVCRNVGVASAGSRQGLFLLLIFPASGTKAIHQRPSGSDSRRCRAGVGAAQGVRLIETGRELTEKESEACRGAVFSLQRLGDFALSGAFSLPDPSDRRGTPPNSASTTTMTARDWSFPAGTRLGSNDRVGGSASETNESLPRKPWRSVHLELKKCGCCSCQCSGAFSWPLTSIGTGVTVPASGRPM